MSLPITYVVTMPQRQERIESHLKQVGLTYRIWPAFDGKKMGISTSIPYLRDHTDWKSRGQGERPDFFVGAGINALALTNFAIIASCLANGIEEVLILEDDALLVPDFQSKFETIRSELPADFKMCHLGHCCEHYLNHHSANVRKGQVLCTQAMLYSKAGMKVIMEKAVTGVPWDIFLFDIMPSEFVCVPQLVSQLSLTGQLPTTLS